MKKLKNLMNKKGVSPVRVAPTRFDRVLDLVGLCLLLFVWSAAIRFYTDAPERVPLQFDMEGNPRSWGSPGAYLLLAGLTTFIMVVIWVSTLYPALINLPVILKKETVVAGSALMARCVRWMNILCGILMLMVLMVIGGFQYPEPILAAGMMVRLIVSFVVLVMPALTLYYRVKINRLGKS